MLKRLFDIWVAAFLLLVLSPVLLVVMLALKIQGQTLEKARSLHYD